jgi:hypothetical protein
MNRNVISVSVCILLAGVSGQSADKTLKPGEFDAYNAVVIDVNGSNFARAVADLDTWKQKFPETEYKDERAALYVQAYAGANQPRLALSAAAALLGRDLDSVFGADGQATVIRVLYAAAWSASQVSDVPDSDLAAGEKAAHLLMDYDRRLPTATPEQWATVRADMREKASAALLHIAIVPGLRAMAAKPPDCKTAETVFIKAVGDHPEQAAFSYQLGLALNCLASTEPEKLSVAIYEFERSAVAEQSRQAWADSYYTKFHGSDEGLGQLKQLVKDSPLPPAGFHIRTVSEIAEEKRVEFEKSNPQLALWMKIKAALTDANGEQYFESSLKDAGVPPLRGTLVDAKPVCRPTELRIAVPLPDATEKPTAEILVKLDKAILGRAEAGGEIQWEGVPTAFTKQPFLLTMTADASKLQGLKVVPCGVSKKR